MMKVGEYFAKLCKRVRNPQNFINMTIQQVVKIFKVGIKEKSIYLSIYQDGDSSFGRCTDPYFYFIQLF